MEQASPSKGVSHETSLPNSLFFCWRCISGVAQRLDLASFIRNRVYATNFFSRPPTNAVFVFLKNSQVNTSTKAYFVYILYNMALFEAFYNSFIRNTDFSISHETFPLFRQLFLYFSLLSSFFLHYLVFPNLFLPFY